MARRYSLRNSALNTSSRRIDRAFAASVTALALVVPLTLAGIALLIVLESMTSLRVNGLAFLTTTTWDPVKEVFGAAAYLYGTIVTTIIAVVLAAPVAINSRSACSRASRVIWGRLSARWRRSSTSSAGTKRSTSVPP